MKILGNPILGKIFSGSSLSLNDEGLYRKILGKYGSYKIFLTKDVKLICELLELDFDLMDEIDEEDAYEIIMDSPYFNHECFEGGKKMDRSTSLSKFLAYYEDYPIRKTCGERKAIRTAKIEQILKIDLRSMIDSVKVVIGTPNASLSGKEILQYT